jgi:hypothetical protein
MISNTQFAMPPTQMMNLLVANFRPTQKIKINHQKKEFKKLIEDVENELELFDENADMVISNFKIDDETKIRKFQKRCRIKIILNSLSSDFTSKFEDQIEDLDSTKLITFIKNRIGIESNEEIANAAKEKIKSATRQVHENEKFMEFLDRLKSYSRKMPKLDEVIKTHLVTEAFRENLNAKIKRFLLEHEKNEESIEDTAKFLDKMQKYKKEISVNEIAVSSEVKEIKNQIEALTLLLKDNSINTMQQLTEIRNEFKTSRIQNVDVLKISPEPRKTQITNLGGNTNQTQKFEHNPNWEYNRFGKPFRCRHCGILGHKDESCKGTNLNCMKCQKIGHTFPACPENPRRTIPKN